MVKVLAAGLMFAVLPVNNLDIRPGVIKFDCNEETKVCTIPMEDFARLLQSNSNAIRALREKSNCGIET